MARWWNPATWGRKSTLLELYEELAKASASKAGVSITWQTMLQASTALACARVIADGLAQVPLKLHRALPGGGSELAIEHPLYSVVSTAPNPELTSFEWRETAGLHLAIGNRSYARISRARGLRSDSIQLFPVAPQDVQVERRKSGELRYKVKNAEGLEEEVPAEQMLHLRGPSWNGYEGLDGIRLAREAVGLSLATEEHGARLFKNGATVGGILTTDQNLNEHQRKGLRESWDQAQGGLENAYKTAILWGGMQYAPRAMQNDQAQWIEVRRFQVQEVCRFFRVLPIMVGEADKTATYASSEQMFLAHAVHTMGPWYRRLEQRLDLQLLTPDERKAGLYFRFNVAALLRGSHRDRAEYYRVLHGLGALNPNEIRELEERNPYDGGDDYLRPLNMVPVGAELPAPGAPPKE